MPKKRYNAQEIIHKLREADVLLSQGMNVGQVSIFRYCLVTPRQYDLMNGFVARRSTAEKAIPSAGRYCSQDAEREKIVTKQSIGSWTPSLSCLAIFVIGLVPLTVPVETQADTVPMLSTVRNANGNVTADLAVIYKNRAKGNYELAVKDSLTGQQISKAVFGPQYSPIALVTSPDLNGNGVDELWTISEHDDGRARSRGRDAATGQAVGNAFGFGLNSNYPSEIDQRQCAHCLLVLLRNFLPGPFVSCR